MRPQPLRKPPSFCKQDIAASVLVAIYIALIFLLVLAWNYLSEKADAFVNEAKQVNPEDLVDIVRVQLPPMGDRIEDAKAFGVAPRENSDFRASPTSGTPRH